MKEPFLCPNNWLSKSSAGIAPQFIAIKGFLDLSDLLCISRAYSSLPQPLSPVINTEPFVGAIDAISFRNSLVGLLFLNPLVGAAVGAGVGAASGAMTDLGINDGFLKEVGEALGPGKAALCLLVKEATTDRVIEKLRRHAGHTQLLQTNLSHTDEDHLKELLDQAKQQAEALRLS